MSKTNPETGFILGMEGTVFVHHGSSESIPPASSPGLQFLYRFIPALDSVGHDENRITHFFAPNAPILVGSSPPTAASQAVSLMEVRSRHLSRLHHTIHIAWDIDLAGDRRWVRTSDNNTTADENSDQNSEFVASLAGGIQMKRTVMFEATSATTFEADPDQFAVQVREFNILDLEGHDASDLQIVEMRIFLDQRPIQAYASQLHIQ